VLNDNRKYQNRPFKPKTETNQIIFYARKAPVVTMRKMQALKGMRQWCGKIGE
jgi:hypothetical protein